MNIKIRLEKVLNLMLCTFLIFQFTFNIKEGWNLKFQLHVKDIEPLPSTEKTEIG